MAVVPVSLAAQDFKYQWMKIPVTSEYDSPEETIVSETVAKAREGMAYLFEVVAYAEKELASYAPESPLSNLTADMVRTKAADYSGRNVDCAFYNMGGIRKPLPKGKVTLDDIFSCYPFRNTLVVVEMTGSELVRFFEDFAAGRKPQAVSGVTVVMDQTTGTLKDIKVGGRPVDMDRTYRMATISFLLDGGDGYRISEYASDVFDTGIQVKDAVLSYMKDLTDKGLMLDSKIDGRLVIENSK